MNCTVSEEQLWSWIDRGAQELDAHLATCPRCRQLAAEIRSGIHAGTLDLRVAAPPPPERIGSYTITGLLGEGGQGLVYSAQQQSPRRTVALKVLKGGRSVSPHDVRHFEREVQSLAALNHPGIATIYEAGQTEDGQRFFAMELVGGVPLDVYVRERALSVKDRLALFCQVCDAVQYAHERGVVHRDLKPTNILVAEEGTKGSIGVPPGTGGVGQPKVLDFGLARITNAGVTRTLTATQTGQIMGTWRYMSPGQARGNPEEIDARSDVYSLGVILYELLTDQPPYELSPVVPHAVTTICETPPRRPSSTVGWDGRPARHLRGDLDTILLKALEKESARRYQSVAEFAADLRRHLDNEPILARPPSGLYVLKKTLSKHRRRIALATVLLAAGLGGGIWWTRQALEQKQQREMIRIRRTLLVTQQNLENGRSPNDFRAQVEGLRALPSGAPEAVLIAAQIWFRLGCRRQEEGPVANAIETLTDGTTGGPAASACRTLLAEIYRARGDSRAPALTAQARREDPQTTEGWYIHSFATLEPLEAKRCAHEAVRLDPKHFLALERLAHLAMRADDLVTASDCAERLVEGDNANWEFLSLKGAVLLKKGQYDEAVAAYSRAIEINPQEQTLYRGRAAAHVCLKRYRQAVKDGDMSVNLEGAKDVWCRYFRATALWLAGEPDAAAADYRAFSAAHPGHVHSAVRLFLVLEYRAQCSRREDHPDRAADMLRDADRALATLRQDESVGSWGTKVIRCIAGELTPEELIAGATSGDVEELCEAYYYAGEVCAGNGRLAEARGWFQKCVDTGLVFDRDVFPPVLMNEYHIAVWRLEELPTETGAPPVRGG